MRLIDADAANVDDIPCFYGTECRLENVEEWLDEQPTVDAEPVRHAVWRRKDKEQALFGVEWECTNCHDTIVLNGILTPIGNGFMFCPYCGAKMEGCETSA